VPRRDRLNIPADPAIQDSIFGIVAALSLAISRGDT
jgi:hypothetical protein